LLLWAITLAVVPLIAFGAEPAVNYVQQSIDAARAAQAEQMRRALAPICQTATVTVDGRLHVVTVCR